MDLATPDRATLAAAQPSPEEAAAALHLTEVRDYVAYHLPEHLAGIIGVLKLLEAYAFDMLESNARLPGMETLYNGLTALAPLLAALEAKRERAEAAAGGALDEFSALRTATGTLSSTVLHTLVLVATGAPVEIEAMRTAAHELHRLTDRDEAFSAALHAYEAALEAHGWRLRWTVTPTNTPYLELDSAPAGRK